MAEEIGKKIVDDLVKNAVQEVDGKECLCGGWSLRISRIPKTPAPAKTEVSSKVESTESPQSEVVAV